MAFQNRVQDSHDDEMDSQSSSALFYQSVDELQQPVEATITGTIPKWITGTLLRNGPGKFEVEQMSYRHLFDGLALLQQFVIEDGNVTYFNKFLRSQTYQKNMKAGMIVESELGTSGLPDPCKNIFARWFSYFFPKEYTDNASINFCCIKGKIYAMTEVPIITEVDPNSLESVDRVKLSDGFQDTLRRLFSATPHPHEEEDGSVYNLTSGYHKRIGLAYLITVIPRSSDSDGISEKPLDGAKVVAALPASHLAYFHSFGMTQKYFIFIEQPLTVNLWKLATSRFLGRTMLESLYWDSKKATVFHVISRETGEVVSKFSAESFFFFHVVNAYDMEGDVFVDLCCYNDSKIFFSLYLEEIRKSKTRLEGDKNPFTCELRRYRLPVAEITASSSPTVHPLSKLSTGFDYDILSETSLELPRINEKHSRLRYRFVYGTCSHDDAVDGLNLTKLVKVNVEMKETSIWMEEGCVVSEPVFIPAPESQEEDVGVVLSAVYDTINEKSFLLVLDGQTFTEVGRAEVLVRFAPTLHGRFVVKTE